MKDKKISIVTINFNNAEGLQKTIDSVLNQAFPVFEYIIIDGGSTDGSKELLKKNNERLSYWVSEADRGIYHAMNKGIRACSGDYLLFLNSGDSLYNEHVLEKVSNLIDGEKGIYYGDIIYDERDKEERRNFPKTLTFGFFFAHNISHQASFIKRELFETLFYYNESNKIVSDWEFFIYAICKENIPYQHMDIIVSRYDATGISSIIENHTIMNLEREQTILKYFPLFKEDYETINQLKSKRFSKFIYINNHNTAWKILNALMNVILLFLPKRIK